MSVLSSDVGLVDHILRASSLSGPFGRLFCRRKRAIACKKNLDTQAGSGFPETLAGFGAAEGFRWYEDEGFGFRV